MNEDQQSYCSRLEPRDMGSTCQILLHPARVFDECCTADRFHKTCVVLNCCAAHVTLPQTPTALKPLKGCSPKTFKPPKEPLKYRCEHTVVEWVQAAPGAGESGPQIIASGGQCQTQSNTNMNLLRLTAIDTNDTDGSCKRFASSVSARPRKERAG